MGALSCPGIAIQVLEPIDLGERFGEHPNVDAVYEPITTRTQQTLDACVAQQRLPVIG
jgi:hypothetical protein